MIKRLTMSVCLVVALGISTSVLPAWGTKPAKPVPQHAHGYVTSAVVDLNGIGKAERISLSGLTDRGDFLLQVGKASVRGRLGDLVDGFRIVDIDAADKYKEIAVHTSGPSDDFEWLVYWYDGKAIRRVAYLPGWARFTGAGIVYVGEHMEWWSKTERYVLDAKTHTLRMTSQEMYHVGVRARVNTGFPLYASRNSKSVIANLRANSAALILLWEPKSKWYVVKSESDIVGWANEGVLWHNMTLPAAD
jgi:hypothetical protein